MRLRATASLLSLLALCAQSAHGLSCATWSIEVFPPSGFIPPNPIFVLQGRGSYAAERVEGLTLTDVALRSATATHELRVLERGGGYSKYLLLTTAEPVLPETAVSLQVKRAEPNVRPEWIVLAKWTVAGPPDRIEPSLSQAGNRVIVSAKPSLWGDTLEATLPVTASESPIAYFASVEERTVTGIVSSPETLFLFPFGPQLFTNPCGANYFLRRGHEYLVSLVGFDPAGNRSNKATDEISVEIP
jgi:hypothetical protein